VFSWREGQCFDLDFQYMQVLQPRTILDIYIYIYIKERKKKEEEDRKK